MSNILISRSIYACASSGIGLTSIYTFTCQLFPRCLLVGLFFLLFSCFRLPAQERTLRFEQIGLRDGLPEGQILQMLQDSQGFIWFGTMSGLVRYDGYDFILFTYDPQDSTALSHPVAAPLLEDKQGDIWVMTPKGLNRFQRKMNRFQQFLHDPDNPQSLPYSDVNTMYQDQEGMYWVGMDGGLARFDGTQFEEISLPKPMHPEVKSGYFSYSIIGGGPDTLWVGTNHGLLRITKNGKDVKLVRPDAFLGTPHVSFTIYKVYQDPEGIIWVCSLLGLYKFHPRTEQFEKFHLPDPFGTSGVFDMVQDTHGQLWLILTNDQGLLRLNPTTGEHQHFYHDPGNAYGLGNNRGTFLMIDQLNQLWIGTYNGLNKLDLNPSRFSFLQQKPGIGHAENLIYKAHLDMQGGVWYSTYDKRLFYAEKPGLKAQKINLPALDFIRHPFNNFCSTWDGKVFTTINSQQSLFYFEGGKWNTIRLKDSREFVTGNFMEEDILDKDHLWVSTSSGLCRIHRGTLEETYFPPTADIYELQNNQISNAIQLPGGIIYVHLESYYNGRLGRFHKSSGQYELLNLTTGQDKNVKLHIRQFAYTPDGTLWIAAAQGLGRYTPETGEFNLLGISDGLAEPNLMGIVADSQGNIWFKSLHHISRFDPASETFWHFRILHDMQEFNTLGAIVGPGGYMLFHGNNGFYYFHPDSVSLDTTRPGIVLTDFEVLHKSRHFGTSPELIREISLTHADNVFTFEFAALHVKNPRYCQYKYKLEGFDPDWIAAGPERKAIYTNLPAGTYVFRAIAANEDGIWNKKGLEIQVRIHPPIWLQWWAKMLYGLLAMGLLWGIYRFQIQRKLEAAETHRLMELNQVKTRLYTNITHEFRTPLTVIQGMANKMGEKPEKWLTDGVSMIKRNSHHLLQLVNQMLDLAKLESGRLSLHIIQADVIPFVYYLAESFHSYAASKGIAIHILSQVNSLEMDYDPDRLTDVLSNLLSNAIKFTPEGGYVNVSLSVEKTSLVLIVEDTGIGIPEEKLVHIFDRFYQVDDSSTRKGEGTGIGLALTKELVALMGGEITAQSPAGEGSKFMVRLPIHRNALHTSPNEILSKANGIEREPAAVIQSSAVPVSHPPEAPHLLLVEDKQDVMQYLAVCLQEDYQLSFAYNGQSGIDTALEQVPDIIISDVMMPEKDGFELCQTLKTDIRTSHIPIILLTARADIESRLSGLQRGADAYLAKPFNEQELRVRLEKLLELRQRLQEKYSSETYLTIAPEAPTIEMIDLEDQFIQDVREAVESHLDDSGLDVGTLCLELGLSRTVLHNKLKALTGKSTTEYMRFIRLRKAREMLLHTNLNVSEIAYQTGFTSPSYFSRMFSGLFGVSPSGLRNPRD